MASRRINSKYRVDFGTDLVRMYNNLSEHERKKGYEYAAKANGWATKSGLGRGESQLPNRMVPWNRVSGATRKSLTARVEQLRKTGQISDAFKFIAYHDMAIFKQEALAYYKRDKDYIIFLQAKYGNEYLFDLARDVSRSFLKNLEGTWGRA